MQTKHYYHVYAGGRNWFQAIETHIDSLTKTGLLEEVSPIYVGFVGNPTQIQAVKDYLQQRQVDFISVAESPSGWEQVTLDRLYLDALESEPFKVLYAHTKGATYRPVEPGASYRDLLSKYWRDDMTNGLFGRWREAVEKLDEYDLVGIYWVPRLNFFAGNFWGATSEYIKTIGPPDNSNRMDAEAWIRKNRALRAYDLQPGFPTFARPDPNVEGRAFGYWEPYLSKELGMEVTFRADGRVLKYSPGKIYKEQLTPLLKKVLEKGEQLVLIDPPSIEQLSLEPQVPAAVEYLPEPEEAKEEVEDHGSDKSADIPETTRPAARQDYGDRTKKTSGERTSGSEEPSSEKRD